jgi:hypothetical protein
MRRETEIDHIDPRWREGRDYQLVCGLDCPLNYREEDWKRNTAKSNRFLSWRWSRDELGVVPEEPGDLAWFLVGADIEKDIPGEWVLMGFLEADWFQATRSTMGGSRIAETRVGYRHSAETRDKIRKSNTGKPVSLKTRQRLREINLGKTHSDDTKKKLAEIGKAVSQREGVKEAQKRGARTLHSQRWMCTVSGYVSTSGPLSRYQKARGIDTSNRIRIK